jgi:hypothetical protein
MARITERNRERSGQCPRNVLRTGREQGSTGHCGQQVDDGAAAEAAMSFDVVVVVLLFLILLAIGACANRLADIARSAADIQDRLKHVYPLTKSEHTDLVDEVAAEVAELDERELD